MQYGFSRVTRRKAIHVLLGFIFALFLAFQAGCMAVSTPVEKTFRLAWENSPRTIDPRYAIDADSQYLGDFVHCALVSYDSSGKIKNGLASEIHWVDSKTLDVTLRPAVFFSNQKEVTAEDIQANFAFFKTDPTDPSPLKANFSGLKSVEVLGKHQLRFNLNEPDGEFISNLVIGILPKDQALGGKLNDPKTVVGCGTFLVDSWKVGFIQLKRRVNDPLKDVQFIRIDFVKDENTRLLKLRNSELDLAQNSINRDQLAKISEYKNLKFMKSPGLNTSYLAFQFGDPILKNRKVRQAIAYGIDRRKIIEHVFHGAAIPAKTILTPVDQYFNQKLKEKDYNPTRANQLLDEAGYTAKEKGGVRFTIKLKTTTNPNRLLVAHAVADDLSKIGIELQIDSMDWGKFKSDVDKGIAQTWNLNWIGFKGPDIYRFAFASSSIPPNGGNRGRVSIPRLDELLSRAKSEVDFQKRKVLYDEVQEIVDTEVPYVFLWHEEQFAVLNERVNNYELYADGRLSAIENVSFKTGSK